MNTESPFDTARLEGVLQYLRQLAGAHFYGSVVLKFDRGRLIHITRQESILPETVQNQARSEEKAKLRSLYESTSQELLSPMS